MDTLRNAWLANVSSGLLTESDIAGHDKSHFCTATTDVLHTADQVLRLRNEVDVIYVMAMVTWRDDQGKFESQDCHFMLPKELTPFPDALVEWRSCVTGHNGIRLPFTQH